MRTKFSLCVFGAFLLLMSTDSRGQYPADAGVGATISFDGKPTMDTNMTKGCNSFYYQAKYIYELLKVCNIADAGNLSDEQIQTQIIDGIKTEFTVTVTNASVAGLPGKKFDGNKISGEGAGAKMWGEVTNVRHAPGARVYLVEVIQTDLVKKLSDVKKLENDVELFLETLSIQDQPSADATQPPSTPAGTTQPPLVSEAPSQGSSGKLAYLSPHATQAEIAYNNKLKAGNTADVSAFIKAQQ